jgi:hypothetical protein
MALRVARAVEHAKNLEWIGRRVEDDEIGSADGVEDDPA